MLKIPRKESGMLGLFILSIIIFMGVLVFIGVGGSGDDIRYIGLIITVMYGTLTLVIRKKRVISNVGIGNEIKGIYFVAALFFVLSVIQAKKVGHSVATRTYVQIFLILMPAIMSFLLLNLLSKESIHIIFRITLVFSVIFYFIEIGPAIFLEISNWSAISYQKSYSPFESSYFSGYFFILFIYFYYIVKEKKTNNYYDKCLFGVSLVFSIVSFKRLSILYTVLLLLLGRFFNFKRVLPRFLPLFSAVGFTVITQVYCEFVKGNINLFDINVYTFTTGRDYILSLWAQYGFFSYGYGSSYEVIGRYLEMDLVQIYLEIGVIALFAFSYCYFNIGKGNYYSYIIVVYAFLNMLTASSIPDPLAWTLMILVISGTSTGKFNVLGMNNEKRKKFRLKI